MNSALISVAPADSTVNAKASERRTNSQSSSSDDSAGFAGVFATQFQPQQAGQSADANGSQPVTGNAGREGSPTAAGALPTEQAGDRRSHNRGDDSRVHEEGSGPERRDVISGKPASATDTVASLLASDKDSAKPLAIAHDRDASLPGRFSEIIAALPRNRNGRIVALDADRSNAVSADMLKGALTASSASNHGGNTHAAVASTWKHQSQLKQDIAHDKVRFSISNAAGERDRAELTNKDLSRFAVRSDIFGLAPDTTQAEALFARHVDTDATLVRTADIAGLAVTQPDAAPFSAPGFSVTGPAATAVELAQPLSSPQWAPEFGRQFVSLIRAGENGSQIAELRLDPPELGPLRVTINLNDNVIQAVFTSSHASVRNAVEQALPQLQQQLAQEGLSLGQASVGQHSDHPGQASADSDAQGGKAPGFHGVHSGSVAADNPVGTSRPRAPDALVDVYA